MADVLVLIPARMASTRLPGKPLADLCGKPMIVHVLERAVAAAVGPIVVATDSEEIIAAVGKAGGRAVMTRGDHESGSDRIHEAAELIDPERRARIVVNEFRQDRRLAGCSRSAARALFHPRHRAVGRGSALPSFRALCVPPRRARPLRRAGALGARAPREARAAARARSRHAHRRGDRRSRAPRGQHARGPGIVAGDDAQIAVRIPWTENR